MSESQVQQCPKELMDLNRYIGTKIVLAKPMIYRDYWAFKTTPDTPMEQDQNPPREGYIVRYEDGYISWSPKDAFEKAYRQTDSMNFGLAIEAAKQGKKIARSGWNGKSMFVFLCEGRMITGVDPSSPMGGLFESRPHLCMKDAEGKCVVGWLASQTDILSDDWFIVE